MLAALPCLLQSWILTSFWICHHDVNKVMSSALDWKETVVTWRPNQVTSYGKSWSKNKAAFSGDVQAFRHNKKNNSGLSEYLEGPADICIPVTEKLRTRVILSTPAATANGALQVRRQRNKGNHFHYSLQFPKYQFQCVNMFIHVLWCTFMRIYIGHIFGSQLQILGGIKMVE